MEDFSFKKIVENCLKQIDEVKMVSEEQERFLAENQGILFEYYAQVTNPRTENHILKGTQVWIYSNDRTNFTPHCHVMLSDRSIEVEVSLIDFAIINVKSQNNTPCDWSYFNQIKKPFFNWIKMKDKYGLTRKVHTFIEWDRNNPNNALVDYVNSHKPTQIDTELVEYVDDMNKEIEKAKKYK